MGFLHLDRLLGFLTGTEFLLGLLYAAIAGIAVALVVLITTRWGQSRPLEKCLVLSVLLHVWLAAFPMTVRLIRPSLEGGQPVVRIRLVDAPLDRMSSAEPLRPEPEPPPAASAAPPPPANPPLRRRRAAAPPPPPPPRTRPGRWSHEAPEIYRLRTAPDRDQVAKQLGS